MPLWVKAAVKYALFLYDSPPKNLFQESKKVKEIRKTGNEIMQEKKTIETRADKYESIIPPRKKKEKKKDVKWSLNI